jgi:hypothetical protein
MDVRMNDKIKQIVKKYQWLHIAVLLPLNPIGI